MLTLDKGEVPDGEYIIPLGVADIKRPGSDVTIVATAWMVKKSLAAAGRLAGEGISAEVIDPRTLAPLDVASFVRGRSHRRRSCRTRLRAPSRTGEDGDCTGYASPLQRTAGKFHSAKRREDCSGGEVRAGP
jgi:hypothetical protein